MANLLGLDGGFEQDNAEAIRIEIAPGLAGIYKTQTLNNMIETGGARHRRDLSP
jgi:hypothetical protein